MSTGKNIYKLRGKPQEVEHRGRGRECPQEVKDAVLERIGDGMGIVASMRESGYHHAEIYKWCRQDQEYAKRFALAKEALAHFYAQDSVDLLDNGSAEDVEDSKRASAHVNLLNARSKARQWLASKWNSQEYGEKLEHRGQVTQAVVLLPPLDPLPPAATARIEPAALAALQTQPAPQNGEPVDVEPEEG